MTRSALPVGVGALPDVAPLVEVVEVGRWPAKGRKGAGRGSSSSSSSGEEEAGCWRGAEVAMGKTEVEALAGLPSIVAVTLTGRPRETEEVEGPVPGRGGAMKGIPSRSDMSLVPLAVEERLIFGAKLPPVRGRTCVPVSKASEERAECGTSKADMYEAVLAERGSALETGVLGLVKVTL